jgi:hypothetical protein
MKVILDKGPSGRIRGLTELLADMTHEDVLRAISQYDLDSMATFGYTESTDYDLSYEGRRFPPKAIFGSSASRVIGRVLTSDEFTGGESSTCFQILRKLGFTIIPKVFQQKNSIQLEIKKDYSRADISKIFEKNKKFTSGTGTFGISALIESPFNSGNFIFLVTLTESHPVKMYNDHLTEDGYLDWMFQNRNAIDSKVIQKLLAHDSTKNNIHLFARGKEDQNYIYIGLLEYFSHDPKTSKPVHFVWHVINWDFNKNELLELGINVKEARNPNSFQKNFAITVGELSRVSPPSTQEFSNGRLKRKEKDPSHNDEVDWAVQDSNNRRLGLSGEKWVVREEIRTLTQAGRLDLVSRIRHVALFDSCAGYDILSFSADGVAKKIEVKTTKGARSTPFYISINEVRTSADNPQIFWLYRLFEFDETNNRNQYFVLNGSVEDLFHLKAITFKARAK